MRTICKNSNGSVIDIENLILYEPPLCIYYIYAHTQYIEISLLLSTISRFLKKKNPKVWHKNKLLEVSKNDVI